MATEVQDDYLDCGAYKAHIGNKSATHPGFITFSESNGNHLFAWVNGDEIVMRSEAYPDAEKMERGIKAILKNCDLPERYSVTQEDGKYLLLLWGGGNHQEHTGNREQHSEIGRSCPHDSREALNALLQFKGSDFANKVVPIAGGKVSAAPLAAAAVATAAAIVHEIPTPKVAVTEKVAAATNYASTAVDDTVAAAGGGMGWLKWLLPLLLLAALLYWWKGCDHKTAEAVVPAVDAPKVIDTPAVVVTPTKTSMMVKLADSTEINAYKGGIEDQLVTFLNNKAATIDTADKKANWYTFDDLNFVFGKTTLTDSSKKQVSNLLAVMKAYPNLKFKIGAYTDKKGDDASNLKLSQGRAEAVLAAIKAGGGDVSRITKAEGYGETLAVVPESGTDEERLKDRRTAIRVVAK